MAAKYQYSKLVMEKFLRRSFYDAVLELYEASQGTKIISVSLEGNLTLIVNRDENFVIKLNEVAQRADDRDDHTRYKDAPPLKLERFDQYGLKKEENASEPFLHSTESPGPSNSNQDTLLNNNKFTFKDSKARDETSKFSNLHYDNVKSSCNISDTKLQAEVSHDKPYIIKPDADACDKSSGSESESEDEADIEPPTTNHQNLHHNNQFPATASETAASLAAYDDKTSHNSFVSGEDIVFPSDPSFVDYSSKRRYDQFKDQEKLDLLGRKSPHKKRKIIPDEVEEDLSKLERDKLSASATSTNIDDSNLGGLQLLPHTATGPIIVEDEDNYNNGISESQMAQLAMMQMREQNMNMFRPQDLEELARQQQQWQMVAYQRSIMEKSYLQHHMQQYQRDTERLRWEYVAQHSRDYSQSGEEQEKSYKQSSTIPSSSSTDTSITPNISTVNPMEEAKKGTFRDTNMDLSSLSMEALPSQYMRMFSEDQSVNSGLNPPIEADYEEGELRHEFHNCALCLSKFPTMESLLRHMEKHRASFERTCSVCQLGTLTGSMLILHMEASHGPDPKYSLPSSVAVPNTTSSSADASFSSSSLPGTDYSQYFPSTPSSLSTSTGFTSILDHSNPQKLQQQPQHQHLQKQILPTLSKESPQANASIEQAKSDMSSSDLNNYVSSTASSVNINSQNVDSNASSSSDTVLSESFAAMSSQYYPLIVCQVCGEKFALSEALDQHVETNHKDAAVSYSCKVCTLTFPKHAELSKHMLKHEVSSSNLKCSHCLKSFKSVKQLRLHYVAAHSCCHFCEYCRAGFPDAMALQLHEQLHTLDPEKLTFRCDICNKAFYTQSQCSAHKRTHKEEKAHVCDLCGSAFFKRGDLTKHTRTVHLPSRLFACKFCGKKGTRMDNMRSHVKSHHKNMNRDQIIDMIEVIE